MGVSGVRTRVKICGITRPEGAREAAEAGADAIGLVFAESPRRVTPAAAARIVRALPPWVTPVGVFVDESPETIRAIAAEAGLVVAQLHGDEPPDTPARLEGLKVIKAFGLGTEADLEAARRWREQSERSGRVPDAYLVDARVALGPRGGTGKTADWDLAARMILEGFRPLILAGGLTPDNVADAVRAVRPWGVDGSSGLESEPGLKAPGKVRAFLRAVWTAGDGPA
ncbi:MAG: phosphoribosylanthranilate isomerase [Planctomycetes bacterium]|nr:phosphoribosylanthranilate isomerase [Planctomycetota bacterium]